MAHSLDNIRAAVVEITGVEGDGSLQAVTSFAFETPQVRIVLANPEEGKAQIAISFEEAQKLGKWLRENARLRAARPRAPNVG
jgi:hypothetical protein